MAPVNWRFRSGDRFELNANPTGERLVDPFEIADGVVNLDPDRVAVGVVLGVARDGQIRRDVNAQTVSDERLREMTSVNTRLRWTFSPVGDLFVVYNHNVREMLQRWQLDSNQLVVKFQYA